MFPLYFPQVANEHIKYVLLIYLLAMPVGGEQLRSTMKATSVPSSTVDRSTGEDNIIIFFKQNFVYANSDSGLLFIMYDHCSPVVVVWYNYHDT